MPNKKETTVLELKARVLKTARELLSRVNEDVESGIEDGVYEENENIETRKAIEDAEALFDLFEKTSIDVYVYVEGGNIQGASATVPVNFIVFDKDNYEGCDSEQLKTFVENFGEPDEWDAMIKAKTKAGEIVPVF